MNLSRFLTMFVLVGVIVAIYARVPMLRGLVLGGGGQA